MANSIEFLVNFELSQSNHNFNRKSYKLHHFKSNFFEQLLSKISKHNLEKIDQQKKYSLMDTYL